MSLSTSVSVARSMRDKSIFILLFILIVGYITINHNLSSLTAGMQLHAPEGEEYESSYATNHNNSSLSRTSTTPTSTSTSLIAEEAMEVIPTWLQNYVKWHKEQRYIYDNNSNKTITSNIKFLVLVCLRNMKCGGAADRLKPLPYFLLVANRTNRVLLIKWEKLKLEDFQIPNLLDWRYPNDLPLGPHYKRRGQLWDCNDPNIVNTRVLLINNQQDPYRQYIQYFKTDERPQGTFREIFQILFEPSPPLAALINITMTKFGLVPNNYLAAHLRMRYPKRFVRPIQFIDPDTQNPDDLTMFRGWAESAINCVVHKAETKNLPVYFSADNLRIISYILHQSRFSSNITSPVKVVGIDYGHREDSEHPTWKGKSSWEEHEPEEFYNVFLDWYILAHSKCISYGLGGYGEMGARLAGDTCTIKHRVRWDSVKCPSVFDGFVPSPKKIKVTNDTVEVNTIALQSTEENELGEIDYVNKWIQTQNKDTTNETNDDIKDSENTNSLQSPIVTEALTHVPEWFQNYTKWHAEQRKNANKSTKYLVLVCLRDMTCGGASDRLRPLPVIINIAYQTNRVFLIKWEKLLLEDFQIPPKGGMDWRYPKDLPLGPHYKGKCTNCKYYCNLYDCKESRIENSQVLLINSQSDNYKFQRNLFVTPSRPQGTFREIFQILFEPSLPLANIINQTMTKFGLVPGNYLAAHLRMTYPKRFVRPVQFVDPDTQNPEDVSMFRGWAESAINCVVHKAETKNLPVYFSADNLRIISYILHQSRFANNATSPVRVVGIDYGHREDSEHPTWKGKSSWAEHEPEEFYNVFLDWYIIGNSKCVSFGLGGYGEMGARLAGDTCSIQHRVRWDSIECPSVFDSR